jgi:alkanesulfonate monooxygenase SsuD/methylene tetrahydromethanopterin reductase-like flavin-dependent oxidoreductase (luciferase family)
VPDPAASSAEFDDKGEVEVPHTGAAQAARYANACNLIASDVDEVAHKLEVLRAHCEAEGRDYDAIWKTAIYPSFSDVLENTDLFLAEARRYAVLGISQLDVLPDRHPVEYIERVAQLVPALTAL